MAQKISVLRSILGALVVMAACSSGQSPVAPGPIDPSPAPGGAPIRVLMLTATAGFRHDSIAAARQVMAALGAAPGEFTVTPTEDLSRISASSLTSYL